MPGRSSVGLEHSHGVRKAAGSSPVAPTNFTMKKKFLIFAVFLISLTITALVINFFSPFYREKINKVLKKPSLTINNCKINLLIADTPYKRQKGLSGKDSLPPNTGMLFIYQVPGKYPFWMKEMKFDLDFVFIKENKVVHIIKNIPCPKKNEQPKTVLSKKTFDKVLEIPAGTVNKLGIDTNQKITYHL